MKNTWKVAKWEVKRNVLNKTFIISIFITPVMILLFSLLPTLLAKMDSGSTFTLYIAGEQAIADMVTSLPGGQGLTMIKSSESQEELSAKTKDNPNAGFIILDQAAIDQGMINIYAENEANPGLQSARAILQNVLQNYKLQQLGLSENQIIAVTTPVTVNITPLEDGDAGGTSELEKIIPGIFAAFIYFNIFISGSMIFTSSMLEKKERIAEFILSSVKAEDLMQGKILGYFLVGVIQIGIWMALGLPAAQIYFKDIPIIKYLFVPGLLPMAFFALMGYLLFAAIFVSIGATMEDAQSGSSFQGIILIIPMIPFFFLSPLIANPSGTIAIFGSYFPLSSPGVMLLRLSLIPNLPLWEILISGFILLLTTVLVMRLAGKLFKTAILMYGKNATFGEIIKWLRY